MTRPDGLRNPSPPLPPPPPSPPQLLDLLKNYPKDSITGKQISRVNAYFKNPDMTIDNMSKVSTAGKGLLTWVVAISKYYDVAKNVEPLKAKVKTMEKEAAKTAKELEELNTMLAALQVELDALNKNYGAANAELTELTETAMLMEKRLTAASALILGLTGERTRWTKDVETLGVQEAKLVGDCLLTSSFLSYAGAFSATYRAAVTGALVEDVRTRQIPYTDPADVEGLLVNDATVQSWVAQGLPADGNSVQNGILTMGASRFPLCIDPQQQAVGWIKRSFAEEGLTVKTLNESDFMKHLELAIQVSLVVRPGSRSEWKQTGGGFTLTEWLCCCVLRGLQSHFRAVARVLTLTGHTPPSSASPTSSRMWELNSTP